MSQQASDQPSGQLSNTPSNTSPSGAASRPSAGQLSSEDVRHVAELAKLRLSEAEIEQFAGQLSEILDYAARLQEVDTGSVPPTPYVLDLHNVMRDDEPDAGLSNEAALANAPDREDGFFRVRAVFEE